MKVEITIRSTGTGYEAAVDVVTDGRRQYLGFLGQDAEAVLEKAAKVAKEEIRKGKP